MAKVGITDTILRDGHQSQAATRMTTAQMAPMFEQLDKVGYYSLECWGGATFDACLRFLNEDPWERLRTLRKGMPNTKLQMLLRGQNILGYKHYADDVVDFFVKKSIENGIDIIRCFDALNDLRNMETAIRSAAAEPCATLSDSARPVRTSPETFRSNETTGIPASTAFFTAAANAPESTGHMTIASTPLMIRSSMFCICVSTVFLPSVTSSVILFFSANC